MNQEIMSLIHEIHQLLLELEQHIPAADAPGVRLIYQTKEKLKRLSEAGQQVP